MTLLSQSAEPILRRLSSGDRRTRSSGFPLGDLVRVASVVESTHHIRLSNYPGRVLQPYASSLGKSIAAFQSPEVVQAVHLWDLLADSQHPDRFPRNSGRPEPVTRARIWVRPGGDCDGRHMRRRAGDRPGGEVFAAISMSMPKGRFTGQLGGTSCRG
jgi:DNA-binding IclR family transcriptional regulator